MKGIEVKFTLDIKFIIIILLALWFLFSGFWVYNHVMKNEKSIQGNTSSIQAIANFLNSQVQSQRPQVPQIPQIPKKEVKKDGK